MALSPQAFAEELRADAHGDAGIQHIRAALGGLGLPERLEFLARNLVERPIDHAEACRRAARDVERFNVLQGDVIRSSAAFFLGSRVPEQSYLIATSSCDLIQGRRASALLLPVGAKTRADFVSDRAAEAALRKLSLYEHTRYFYLPPFPDDEEDVLFNVAYLDPLHTCDNDAANLAQRRASMTLLGWRLFGVMTRELLVREADAEDLMRTANPPGDSRAS